MCIADLFTTHCDSLTELHAQGKDVEVYSRDVLMSVTLLHKPVPGDLVTVCKKCYLQMTKVGIVVKKNQIRLSFR